MGFRGEEFAFASPDEAVRALAGRMRTVGTESIDLAECRGRVLAAQAHADRDSPAFDHSAMDGFALRAADAARGPLTITGESRIGRDPPTLPDGPCAIRISTGAPIPVGADAVVKREDATENAGSIKLHATTNVITGAHIRRRAENARAGDRLIESGTILHAAAIGVLASAGILRPLVFRRLRLGLITTGDELVNISDAPKPHEIRNSNSAALLTAAGSSAWCKPHEFGIVRDDEEALAARLRDALKECDAIVLSGGVSMGHRDPVRGAVEQLGARIMFHGLPQRPGKPMLGAFTPEGQPIFGLPGNPVSSLVTFTRIVLPALARSAGVTLTSPPPRVRIVNPDGQTLDLWWHRPARLTESGEAMLVDTRGSGDLIAGGRSDGFVEIPPGPAARGGAFAFFAWPR